MGHTVTVFEKADRPGGLLMYGIPNMKLPKEILQRRILLMEEEGIRFRTDAAAGSETAEAFDAAVLCGGAREPRDPGFARQGAKGVCFAVDYLTESTRTLLSGGDNALSARDRHVIVLGGGDTGNDCVATALRQGCASVSQLEMLPAPPQKRAAGNPWPQWPRTLRTDYGQAEAAFVQGKDPRVYETTVNSLVTDGQGRLTAAVTVRLDSSRRPIPGTEEEHPCGLLLIAAGFIGCDRETKSAFGLEADSRGRLMPADGSHHLCGKLFVSGDMRTGQSLVVRALADGREAAREADAFLSGKR